jgi:SAM-dependent methyltransferase
MKKLFSRFLRRDQEMRWSTAISDYLGIPEEEIVKSLGEESGYQKQDKTDFAKKYDRGQSIVTTINRDAEKTGNLSGSWSELKYVAIKQEWLNFRRLELIRDKIIPLMDQNIGKRKAVVMDYGCGTSLFGRLLLKKHLKYYLTLCDVDGYHSRFAFQECRKLSPQTDRIIVTGDDFIPVFDKKYDFIYCLSVLEHIPNALAVIKALKNALAEGGFLLETFGGETGKSPSSDSADSEKAWASRDDCFDYLLENFFLKDGQLPDKNDSGHFLSDETFRLWESKTKD